MGRAQTKTDNAEFDQFWARFPNRVGKLAALAVWGRAREQATLDQILAGVDRYIANKPTYADWCHPKTWLNGGRWLDEYAPRSVAATVVPWSCPHVVRCAHRSQCRDMSILGRPRKDGAA